MNCVLEGSGVKAFGKAIHALSRIGDELWLDPMVRGLALRSVNSAHSAYACFLFSPLFFQHYSLGSASEQSSESIKCKLAMKSILPLFRCLTSIERNVERCQISIGTADDRVMIQFFCRHDHMKTMYTEMSLHPDEFDYFQIGVESDITFCLKELRGLLSFAESHCLPVSVHFGAAGKPVCFSVEDMVLEATVVLATLSDSESKGSSQLTGTLAPSTPRCADAAVLPVGSCEADSSKAQDIPAMMEMIPSSQGSPITNLPVLMLLQPETDDPNGRGVADEAFATATLTPASSMICSLLFRSSEQDDDGCAARLPVLACYSDEEANLEEDYTRSPSL
ncbi:cell cycle checkpoint control protein RAD9B isoform X2 [Etheostoma spectabile]|uniref:cell cycle checkpoint control protein RAD9B isoform X2 n=1 Tax=Etheostoma spectabile TaxID=54343 RepID=UPI0013AF1E20|nr:cell cycle checkpoint control protein RAD9B isoform X2 [Etheostoma spectabile]XP_032371695.1 cell cycle checkpoint control protein RAD9B-like isoform X2 [Etheostoma spectabile]